MATSPELSEREGQFHDIQLNTHNLVKKNRRLKIGPHVDPEIIGRQLKKEINEAK